MPSNGTLPAIPLPTGTVELGGQTVTFQALSRAAAVGLKVFEDHPQDAEPYIVAKGCGISEDEAREWLEATPFEDGSTLIEAIVLLSGLPSKV